MTTTSHATTGSSSSSSSIELMDAAICDLEHRLCLVRPSNNHHGNVRSKSSGSTILTPGAMEFIDAAITKLQGEKLVDDVHGTKKKKTTKKVGDDDNGTKHDGQATKPQQPKKLTTSSSSIEDQPDICKLEFKVGQIIKVWDHPQADKLYCEEIDVGEDTPRQIASGLRPHFTLEQMMGQRLLVITNLKAKNLVQFKSHGMVLCAAQSIIMEEDGSSSERVEFIEPPPEALVGEVIHFEGLPPPQPWSASQVEKKKVFPTCAEHMETTDDCLAAWKGHVFLTSAGPCRAKTISKGVMR